MNINIYENTINEELIDTLKKECIKINKMVQDIGVLKEDKYSTFWMEKDHKPKTFIEHIVKEIAKKDHPDGFPKELSGFEWWVQIKKNKEEIIFHYDKDEGLCTRLKKYNFPNKSTVTYLTDVGGPTLIFKDNYYNKGYLSFPKKNKHIVFQGDNLHGVLNYLGDIPTEDNERITLLINYWNYRPEEPNCTELINRSKLIKVNKKHIELQKNTENTESKLYKMNYEKNGIKKHTIYKHLTPIDVFLSENLRNKYTYVFNSIKTCISF